MEVELNQVSSKWVERHNPTQTTTGKGMDELQKHEDDEFTKIRSKYKNRIVKLLPITDPANGMKFFKILCENFVRMELEWAIDRLSTLVHPEVASKERIKYLKIWARDDV
jgi:hypothetical protein